MVERATEEIDIPVEIELEEKNKNVKNIPALVINGNIISEGKVLTVREITRYIKNEATCWLYIIKLWKGDLYEGWFKGVLNEINILSGQRSIFH